MPVGAAIATASATLGSAALTSSAANNAASDQAKASANNLAFEKSVYNTGLNQLTPTINEGNAAGSELAGLLNTGGNPAASQAAFNNYLGSTNYGFLLGQGEQAQSYLNAPNLQSGATQKALTNYAQGQAGNALSGYEQLLAGQQSLGANSALGLAGFGNQNAGLQANANNLAAGAAGTAGLVGANAQGSALSGLAQLFGQQTTQSSFAGGNSALTTLNNLFNGGGSISSGAAGSTSGELQ